MSHAKSPQHTGKSQSAQTAAHPRLPCRGCMADCTNYTVCDGRPWRIPAATPEQFANKAG